MQLVEKSARCVFCARMRLHSPWYRPFFFVPLQQGRSQREEAPLAGGPTKRGEFNLESRAGYAGFEGSAASGGGGWHVNPGCQPCDAGRRSSTTGRWASLKARAVRAQSVEQARWRGAAASSSRPALAAGAAKGGKRRQKTAKDGKRTRRYRDLTGSAGRTGIQLVIPD